MAFSGRLRALGSFSRLKSSFAAPLAAPMLGGLKRRDEGG